MKFAVKAMRGSEIVLLDMDADDAQAARARALAQGYSVLHCRAISHIGLSWPGQSLPGLSWQSQPAFDVSLFSQELLTLLESGLSLIEAIEGLAEKEQPGQASQVLAQLRTALYQGLPLSQALAQQPRVFTALYVALIRASERTGDLVQALRRHVAYQAQVDSIRKKIIAASIYPAILLLVGTLVVLFLLGYVVPRFSSIYAQGGEHLPWASRMLLQWGQLLQQHGQQVFFISTGVLLTTGWLLTRASVRGWLWTRLWQIPSLGQALRIYQLARFYRTLGMLLQGGIPLLTAMGMVQSLLPVQLQAALQRVMDEVRSGKALSVSMAQHGLTTSIALRMLRVGEHSGNLDQMLERIGIFYDEETARKVEWFGKLLEPTLMVVIGLIVGLVVVLMYMPIFELAGDLG